MYKWKKQFLIPLPSSETILKLQALRLVWQRDQSNFK